LIGKSSFADAMLVATGRSSRHVVALADHVVHALRDAGFAIPSIEGKDTGDWVLIDAGDVVVHLFRPEIRQFYNLEKMWSAPAIAETLG
jgi:ribosome-associated protein